ncbi:MAG: BatD family protein [Bacteroidales bacterium]|nr:BatD family protein [Bacteroidales bacterium]
MRKLLLTFVSVVISVAASAQTGIKVEAPNVVAADEQFNVTFIIEGEDSPSDFQWTPGNDFQVLWGPQQGRSTSLQIINGKRTKSVQTTYTYVLRPTGTGKFTLATATARVKGDIISSSPYSIQVASAGASSSPSGSGSQSSQPSGQSAQRQQNAGVQDGDIFLKMDLSRSKVVVGEPIIATLKLYQRVNIAGFENVNFPTFNGFWSQEIEAPTNIEFAREVYDGQIYNAALLRKFILIPQQQGQIKIDPAELVCLINIRVSSGGTSIFDGFFDDYRTVRKKVSTPPLTVSVSPLPAGAPASFAGGVGTFEISAKLSRDTIKTHEAASLLVTVTGKGNVTLLEAPKVSFPPDMEVYDTKVSDRVDKNGMAGSKYYEFPFIPRSHGDFVIEPINYSYYDVDKGRYVTLQTPPLSVYVEKSGEAESTGGIVVSGPSQKDVRTLGSDIRFINTKAPDLVPAGRFFVSSGLFAALALLLLILSVICWLVFRRIASRRADVVGTKNRKATKMAMKRLHLASTFLKQNLHMAFYEELHKALLGFISDKLNMPVAELSRDRISEVMKSRNVEDSYVEKFIAVLDACEFARYAPDAGHEAMETQYKAAVEIISSIDSNMKLKKTSGKGAVLAVMLLSVLPFAAQAQDQYVDSLWNTANAAYSEGRWSDAAAGYVQISGMGLESASLYCNTGDAYFKDGNVPMAILSYERALKLDPSYADARYNLELMNSLIQDRIDPVPDFILKVWASKVCYLMDSDSWAVCFLVFLALTLGLVLLFLLAPGAAGRRTGFFTGIVTLLMAVMSLSFSLWQKNEYMSADDAIVMRPVTSVKSSPSSESSKDLFILHEGTKVKMIDSVGSWCNIELADGRQGWIPSSDIEVI